jgi:hypothetical protein
MDLPSPYGSKEIQGSIQLDSPRPLGYRKKMLMLVVGWRESHSGGKISIIGGISITYF